MNDEAGTGAARRGAAVRWERGDGRKGVALSHVKLGLLDRLSHWLSHHLQQQNKTAAANTLNQHNGRFGLPVDVSFRLCASCESFLDPPGPILASFWRSFEHVP